MSVSIDGDRDRLLTRVHHVYFILKVCFPFFPSIAVSLLLYFIRPLVFIMQKVKTGTL